jgi:chorismate synthase
LLIYPTLNIIKSTVTRDGQEVELRGKGRHDPCVLPRAVPMVEAMMALTLVDHIMMQKAQCELFPNMAAIEDQPNPMGTTAFRKAAPSTRHMVEVSATNANSNSNGPISQRVDEE